MKTVFFALFLCFTMATMAQKDMPFFLEGNWKRVDFAAWEHWDILNENSMKGFSYYMKDGRMQITEYLDIRKIKGNVIYTATTLKQNGGRDVKFQMTKNDSILCFENPKHDFPQRISYIKKGEYQLRVEGDGETQEPFEYTLQKEDVVKIATDCDNPDYDEVIATRLGADEYGMRSYVMVILKTGSNHRKEEEYIDSCFRGHMANINRLVNDGKLVIAGPFDRNNEREYRGIFIFKAKDFEEAKQFLIDDPMVMENILEAEYYTWYGSAALSEYLKLDARIWKKKP